ncbi:hypothetical protein [Sporichthya sp.]|uniref:hypothetical protein n=1 Tax=Sporichthya sp. TaxID=65475 RepID=UPI00179CF4D2|nr:hypothetical protein [Sporichthya sp.]MBA3745218.1 hypothetical protein [Sporichthya sp.]
MAAGSADAFTAKELKACWAAPVGGALNLTVAVSGPQTGQRTLPNGTCKAWDVPAGVYKFSANANAIRTIFDSGPAGRTSVCGNAAFTGFNVYANVSRLKQSYTVTLGSNGGSFNVPVSKNKLTKANFRIKCFTL